MLWWDDKDPREILPLGFDLFDLLAMGESVIAAEPSIEVVAGTDESPAAMLLGASEIDGRQVGQWIQGGVAGAAYLISIQIDTSLGKRLICTAGLRIRAAGLRA